MMKRIMLKAIFWFIGIILGGCLAVLIAFQVSPRPGVLIISRLFDGPVKITDKESYLEAQKRVEVLEDITYRSTSSQNTFDIYYPKDLQEAAPVLVWAHGGGFVAGDKSGVKEFATKLASDAQVAVVAMNYEVAPDAQYPNQVKQVGELMTTLKAQNYQMLDLERVFFGGDSAGAQIALQYVTTQTNLNYGQEVGIDPQLNQETIKGTISYCGPVDLQQVAQETSDNRFMKFFVQTVAWSLIGTKDWRQDPKLFQASLVEQVDSNFPPTYITDGNAFSFQDQGIALMNRLASLNIPVQGLFYKNSDQEVTHEYQFDYATTEAEKCYEETRLFLEKFK